MATKESVHRHLLQRATRWRESADDMRNRRLSEMGESFTARAEAYEYAARLVSEIDSFEQEGPE